MAITSDGASTTHIVFDSLFGKVPAGSAMTDFVDGFGEDSRKMAPTFPVPF
jgi:hypothetical protein